MAYISGFDAGVVISETIRKVLTQNFYNGCVTALLRLCHTLTRHILGRIFLFTMLLFRSQLPPRIWRPSAPALLFLLPCMVVLNEWLDAIGAVPTKGPSISNALNKNDTIWANFCELSHAREIYLKSPVLEFCSRCFWHRDLTPFRWVGGRTSSLTLNITM